jgi:hypothetical protein
MKKNSDAPPLSQSTASETIPPSVVEAMALQVTHVTRLINEYIQYQQSRNEELTQRIEQLEKRLEPRTSPQ